MKRMTFWVGAALSLLLLGCEKKPAAPVLPKPVGTQAPVPAVAPPAPPVAAPAPVVPAPPVAPVAPPAAAMSKSEVVFDPNKPPAGFINCHRNHCHRAGGGVASYAQVMQEIGAARMVEQPAAPPMPAAPADVASPPADAIKSSSGLASKVITPGKGGVQPGPTSVVTVHYTGWTTDGKAFDSSVARGRPATFPLNRVIPGWTEGLQSMTIGEERRFWIPVEMAYRNQPGKPAGMLVFDVELLSVQ